MRALRSVCIALLAVCSATAGNAADLRALESFFNAQAFRPSIVPAETSATRVQDQEKPAVVAAPVGPKPAPAYSPDERIVMAFQSASGAD